MLRIAICDNEPEQTEILAKYIDDLTATYPGIKYDIYLSGDVLVSNYSRVTSVLYDIIFLDIEMDGTNGVDTAAKIREYDKKALIIYVTNFDDFIFKASDTFMFRYLIKPVPQNKFNMVFEDAHKTLNKLGKTYNFLINRDPISLDVDEIIYFEMVDRYVVVHTITKGKFSPIWSPVKQIQAELEQFGFLKPHKSFLVNMRYIYKLERERDLIILRNHETPIPIGHNQRKLVRDTFAEYEKRRYSA